jgi:hypothetical protein
MADQRISDRADEQRVVLHCDCENGSIKDSSEQPPHLYVLLAPGVGVRTLRPEAVKDLTGADQGPTENRTRIIRLIEQMTCGRSLLVCMHGAGSPLADKMVIGRYTEMEEKKKLAKEITGIER